MLTFVRILPIYLTVSIDGTLKCGLMEVPCGHLYISQHSSILKILLSASSNTASLLTTGTHWNLLHYCKLPMVIAPMLLACLSIMAPTYVLKHGTAMVPYGMLVGTH